MSMVEVKVPDIGDFKEVEVIELMVKPGDTVEVDQSLITVESDKASMEIPSSQAGVVKEIKVKIGDKVAEGSLMLMLETRARLRRSRRPRLPPRRRLLRQRPLRLRRPPGPSCPLRPRQRPRRQLRRLQLRPRLRRSRPAAPSRMRRRRSASLRANWAST